MSSARILAVDDAPQIRRVLKTTLVSAGYETLTAATGEEALEMFARHHPDLVILDLALPDIGGVEVCRQLRRSTDTPILILSVRGAEADKIEALDAGADDYLTKPFGAGELLARIRSSLRRAVPAAGTLLEAGPIRLDAAARRAWNGDEELKLTPKEFDLLRQFASQPGRVLTHRALLQAVWGPDYGEQTEYLRVFVNQLRKKIESDPSRPQLLRTEPWVGYRLLPPE